MQAKTFLQRTLESENMCKILKILLKFTLSQLEIIVKTDCLQPSLFSDRRIKFLKIC